MLKDILCVCGIHLTVGSAHLDIEQFGHELVVAHKVGVEQRRDGVGCLEHVHVQTER